MKRINQYLYAHKTKKFNSGDIDQNEQNVGKSPFTMYI